MLRSSLSLKISENAWMKFTNLLHIRELSGKIEPLCKKMEPLDASGGRHIKAVSQFYMKSFSASCNREDRIQYRNIEIVFIRPCAQFVNLCAGCFSALDLDYIRPCDVHRGGQTSMHWPAFGKCLGMKYPMSAC